MSSPTSSQAAPSRRYPKSAEIYAQLRPALEKIEARRLQLKAKTKKIIQLMAWITGLFVLALVLAKLFQVASAPEMLVGAGLVWLVLMLIIWAAGIYARQWNYRIDFKSQVIRQIIGLLEPGMRYHHDRGVAEDDFTRCNLFDHETERYEVEDGFGGKIGQTQVLFSEAKAYYKTESDKSTSYHLFFDGIFMVADFHKHFRHELKVVPDFAERHFGRLGKKLQAFRPLSRQKLVHLEDPEFEKTFAVYGEDQVEARYILSSSMMRRILDLRRKWRDEVRLGFSGSSVYIAIAHDQDLFELSPKISALDKHQIYQLAAEIKFCFSVVDDLNLNTRVWTKT